MKKCIFLIVFFHLVLFPLSGQKIIVADVEQEYSQLYKNALIAEQGHKYDVAIDYLTKAKTLLISNREENTNAHINTLTKLGQIYYAIADYNCCNNTTLELEKIKANIKERSPRYYDYLYKMCEYYYVLGKFSQSEEVILEVLNDIHADANQSRWLHRLSLCQHANGNIKEAIATEEQCVAMDTNNTANYYATLAYYCYLNRDWINLEKWMPQCFNYARETILRYFFQSPSKDRAGFWGKRGGVFTENIPLYTSSYPSNVLTEMAYDAALFSKSILLEADNKAVEVVVNSEHSELTEQYSRYLELCRIPHRTIDEEGELQALSEMFVQAQKENRHKFRQSFRTKWGDVQNILKEGEAAIEFVEFVDRDDMCRFAAIVLKPEYTAPKWFPLLTEKELQAISQRELYTTEQLYKKIWQPIENELVDCSKVFFSPYGLLCNIGIEYALNEGGLRMYEMMEMVRLTSTRELTKKIGSPLKRVVLYGGLNYDTKVPSISDTIDYDYRNMDSLNLRGIDAAGFNYLQGTETEVLTISSILKGSQLEVNQRMGVDGTEESFKNLTSIAPQWIHIATHGFYYSNKKGQNTTTAKQLFDNQARGCDESSFDFVSEDKALTRSGLVLSGGNYAFKKIEHRGGEDGILYADEIANINLNGVDMVVLSACQSGLGDVVSSEGVFGLQRGFKLAGVDAIVMSLWNVSDDATQILMTEFYRNLAQGQTKHESLFNAQMTLRTINGGIYDDPIYWAAFILLDALN